MEKILPNTAVTGVKALILCLGVLSFRLAGRADGQARAIGRLAGVAAVLEHVFTTIAWGQK